MILCSRGSTGERRMPKRIHFSDYVQVGVAVDYDRRNPHLRYPTTCEMATIVDELNEFKREMYVHPDSRHLTEFYKGTRRDVGVEVNAFTCLATQCTTQSSGELGPQDFGVQKLADSLNHQLELKAPLRKSHFKCWTELFPPENESEMTTIVQTVSTLTFY